MENGVDVMKKALPVILALALIFSAVPLSGISEYLQGSDFGFLAVNSSAASESDLSFELNEDGESYYVSACNQSASGELGIPATYNGKPVTGIGGSAFFSCESLTSVTIPDSVKSIGSRAFRNCISLTSVTIGNSVTSIGDDAFSYCSSLTSVTIGNSVTSIGNYAFSSCSGLESVEIPDSVTSLGYGVFAYCESLATVTMGSGVKSIGSNVFSGCSRLTSVTIPDSVTSIGEYAFNCAGLKSVELPDYITSLENGVFCCCESLSSVTIPDGVKSIGSNVFSGCSRLTSVTIGNSVTSIGEYAFYNCSSLTSVTIPDSVTSIGYSAFRGCSSLASINASADNKYYSSQDGVLFNKDKTELVCCPEGKTGAYIIPSSVTSIGNYAFRDCSSLTSITIPDSVTSIGEGAFWFCSSLTSITIPDSVTSIGYMAFDCCNNDLVIYGFSDSCAETYAGENSITFKTVDILPKGFARVDYANKCIFSEKSIKLLDDCLIADTGIKLEYEKPSNGFIGTGTLVNIKSGDTVIDTFTVVINGDLDGDGVSDVLDVVLANRALNGYGELSAAQAYAANNAADTEIDGISYQNVVNRALGA